VATQVHDGTTKPIVETDPGFPGGHRQEVVAAVTVTGATAGTHANAWNAELEIVDGTSASVDLQFSDTASVFGVADGPANITVQFAQDNTNFADTNIIFTAGGVGFNWGGSFLVGARYVRLKTNAAVTLTGTIAGKG